MFIEKIKKIIDSTDKDLYILNGFSLLIIKELEKSYKHIIGLNKIIENNYLSIDKIDANKSLILSKILTPINKSFITYEEFSYIQRSIKLDEFSNISKIILITNNITGYSTPLINPTLLVDDDKLGEIVLTPEQEKTSGIYSSISKKGDHLWTEQITFDGVENVNLWEEEFVDYDNKIELTNPKAIIYGDYQYYNFIYDLINQRIPDSDIEIYTNEKSFLSHLEKIELSAICEILRLNDIRYRFHFNKTDELKEPRKELFQILADYWNSNSFRKLEFYQTPELNTDLYESNQGKIVEFIVDQVEKGLNKMPFKDVFMTAPTGAGKSAIFQIPAIYLHSNFDSVSIVVSPLIALMKDQVQSLEKRGVNIACYLNSELSIFERQKTIEQIINGEKSLVYLSPEMLLSYKIDHFIGDRKLGLFIIDESHLVTTWGRDFRVDYWYLGKYINKIRKESNQSFPVLSFTATAVYGGKSDVVFETIDSLSMRNEAIFLGNVRRKNVNFNINLTEPDQTHEEWKVRVTKQFINKTIAEGKKAIVYCPYKSHINDLKRSFIGEENEKFIGVYHSDIDKYEKQFAVEDFQEGKKLIILATKAFGMGVDVKDISYVYHFAPSGTLADYVQEIGRSAREESMTGIALTDYCDKDLKFTKILYGISSIRQFHAKYVLEKLYKLYLKNLKQNFLVSIDDFAYIWGNSLDIENKVKSTLMLLEKDLFERHHYNVLLVRPKSLFTKAFICVVEDSEKQFLDIYGNYVTKISDIKHSMRYGGNKCITSDLGSTFEVNLQKLWEEKFPDKSFPLFKAEFFSRKLFTNFESKIFPRYKLEITINKSKLEILSDIKTTLEQVQEVLFSFGDRYFRKNELESQLKERYQSRTKAKRITDLIMSIYSYTPKTIDGSQSIQLGTFIQEKREGNESVFKLIRNSLSKVIRDTVQSVDQMFDEISKEKTMFINTSGDIADEWSIKGAFVIEALGLGTYTVEGGKQPQIFIRINYPTAIRRLVESLDRYSNKYIQDVERRHSEAIDLMSKFFATELSDTERWDFIESYFLGKDLS